VRRRIPHGEVGHRCPRRRVPGDLEHRPQRWHGGTARQLKGCRYARWKNPEHLSGRKATKLAWIARHNGRLYRAYLLKEQLRLVFQHRGTEAIAMLDAWLSWARRCRIPAFTELARRIAKHRPSIEATLTHGLSNALVDRRTRSFASSPDWPTGSAPRTTSSPFACSIEVVTVLRYLAGELRDTHGNVRRARNGRRVSSMPMPMPMGMPNARRRWAPRGRRSISTPLSTLARCPITQHRGVTCASWTRRRSPAASEMRFRGRPRTRRTSSCCAREPRHTA
jgi:hypothetical protein